MILSLAENITTSRANTLNVLFKCIKIRSLFVTHDFDDQPSLLVLLAKYNRISRTRELRAKLIQEQAEAKKEKKVSPSP